MDVGNPSNWVRIADMFKDDMKGLKELVTGFSYDDEETREAIEKIYDNYNYVACPHTAIAWQALKDWQQDQPTAKQPVYFYPPRIPVNFLMYCPAILPRRSLSPMK